MPAVVVVTATWLKAFAMIFLRDFCALACPAVATFVLASMAARLQSSAYRTTNEERRANINMTRYCDLVLTSMHCAIDHDATFCFCGILILPTRQMIDMVPAR